VRSATVLDAATRPLEGRLQLSESPACKELKTPGVLSVAVLVPLRLEELPTPTAMGEMIEGATAPDVTEVPACTADCGVPPADATDEDELVLAPLDEDEPLAALKLAV